MTKLTYPSTKKVDQVDDYHGIVVADPYRWLEDVDSPATVAWIKAQNELTFAYLEAIPARSQFEQRLKELWDYPKASAPFAKGRRYFQFRNDGLQNQDVLYSMDSLQDSGQMLLDPNTLSTDGTIALNNWSISKDGSLLAYATSNSGSDWVTWHVRRVLDGVDLADILEWSKFSDATWLPDHASFIYNRFEEPAAGQVYEGANTAPQLFLHRLGTPQAADELVYARPDQPDWIFDPALSDDGRYLVLHVWEGTSVQNRLFYRDLQDDSEFIELIPEPEALFLFLGNDGPRFYLHTDLDSPRGRVIALDIRRPERASWQTIVPEQDDSLELVKLVHNEFVTLYLHNATHRLRRYSLQGEPRGKIALPGLGSIQEYAQRFRLNGEREDAELYYSFHSFVFPPRVYRYDFSSEQSQELFSPSIDFDFEAYVTEQVFVTSRDGTRLPLFLTHKRDLPRDGRNPTLLYGYGGFALSQTPQFAIQRLAWLEQGGVFAQAGLRGGSEYGEEWHQAGMLMNKQNVFDDFIACAEYLIDSGITSIPRLAIEGRSNGGLLVGACLTQRPDLFGAALPVVGVLDMLRFHKFTIGWAWVSDYGSPDDPDDFQVLAKYSPLHNIHPGTAYPPTLINTGDHDDRVVPGHSFKFAAALQAAQAGEAPILIRIQTKAGHGLGKPTAILIQEQADIYAFLFKTLEMDR
jgi:prolyl oligopeptidase